MTSFAIQSFGCRVNQAEAFAWANEFQKKGYRYEKDWTKSDVILVNTCTVTSRADSDVKGFLRRIRRANPSARLVLTGCYVERTSAIFRNHPQAWQIIPNREKDDLWAKITLGSGSRGVVSLKSFRSRALVKIQDGCDFHCAFCVVPSVRGPSVSLGTEKVLAKVKEYVDQGFQEIVLTGVHLCLYGRDRGEDLALVDLLQKLETVKGSARTRLSSLDPRFLSGPILEYIATADWICSHFHLSLQSGCDRIIRRMGRKICVDDYRNILDFFHRQMPHAALGADILAGFPGESESDFRETFRFLEDSPLTYFHVFPYSPRPGTKAASFIQVHQREKMRRAKLLRELSRKKNLCFRSRFLEKACEGVVVRRRGSQAHVLTSNYIPVYVPSCPAEEKERVNVRITHVSEDRTDGVFIGSLSERLTRVVE